MSENKALAGNHAPGETCNGRTEGSRELGLLPLFSEYRNELPKVKFTTRKAEVIRSEELRDVRGLVSQG